MVLTARPNTHMTVSEVQVLASAPGQSSDAAAAGISVNGQPLAGFDPEVTAYRAASQGPRQEVTATAADPYATVTVEQADSKSGTAVVTVRSEDGSQTRTYEVVVLLGSCSHSSTSACLKGTGFAPSGAPGASAGLNRRTRWPACVVTGLRRHARAAYAGEGRPEAGGGRPGTV